MEHRFLVHDKEDNVGVAVADIKAGEMVKGVGLEDQIAVEVKAKESIPLGHKIALRQIDAGTNVIKYGVPIGIATRHISEGEHVHVHNLKSARW